MTIADDDAHLAKLKLPLNKDMQEGNTSDEQLAKFARKTVKHG